jgi:hypothetical protein
MLSSTLSDHARIAHHDPQPTVSDRLRFARALVALAAGAACGGAPPPKSTDVAARPDAGPVNAPVIDAGAPPDASIAAPSCAVKAANLTPSAEGAQHQCLEGVAPRASDLRVTFTPRTPTVSPGRPLVLDVRIVNVSDHTVSVRTELPRTEDLIVTTETNVTIAPPAGPMPIKLNPNCRPMTCSHATTPRGVVVPLLPGGVIEGSVVWQASHVAWPPPRLQDCVASCMGTDVVFPIATKPLAPGKYRVETPLRAWSGPEWIALTAGADVVVR